MKLYDATVAGTRATRARWLLEELGVPYDMARLDFRKGELKTPEYLAVHPHGKVPAIEIDGQVMIESAAICMQLADLHPEKGLAPAIGTKERALYYQWIVYSASTLDDALVSMLFHTQFLPPEQRKPELVERGRSVWSLAAPFLVRSLGAREWLVGDRFSAADVVIGYDVAMAGRMALLDAHPTLGAYLGRLSARPAFRTAYGAE